MSLSLKGIHTNYCELKDINKRVQLYLREAADRSGMSDLEIAQRSSIPQSTVYRLLNAKTMNPSYEAVLKICDTLNIKMPLSNAVPEERTTEVLQLGTLSNSKLNEIDLGVIKAIENLNISLKSAYVTDNCGDMAFPKGSLVFYSLPDDTADLIDNDRVIIEFSDSNGTLKLPMSLVSAPNPDQWILYQLSNSQNNHLTLSIPKGCLKHTKGNTSTTIVGRIENAFI